MTDKDAATITMEQASLPTTVHLGGSNDSQSPDVPPSTTSSISLLLDPNEAELFQILTQAAEAFARGDIQLEEDEWQDAPRPDRVVIRVAGGWVRDKLLQDFGGTPDVDLAVQHMTGVQCAKVVHQYVQQYLPDQVTASRMGVIAANPAQSKHLETATFRLCGIDMDLSNLRAHEVYTADSRIPVVRLGTPLEDALRRDFTVNALFYNLHTQQVEDWTGRAVRDLLTNEKKLVTPLEPVQTFRDDPLRILRAVRFAVRLDLPMDEALQQAAQLPEIRHALGVKVSRERFGKELEGMLSGKRAKPLVALNMMIDLQLTSIVFGVPNPAPDGKVASVQGTWPNGQEFATNKKQNQIEAAWKEESKSLLSIAAPILQKCTALVASALAPDSRLLPLAIALSPFRRLEYNEVKKPDRWNSVVGYMVRESIKFKKDDVTALTLLTDHVDAMVTFLDDVDKVTRLEVGLLLRSMRNYWSSALVLATILKSHQDASVDWMVATEKLYRKIVQEYDLDQCWKVKPLVDGKVLQKTFGKGPIVGLYMEEQVRWMLSNPQGNAEDCLEHLRRAQVRGPNPPKDGRKRKKS